MYNTLIVEPFGWVLRTCYNLIGSYGVAIIIFTIFAKAILLPFQMKSKKSMVDMQRLQPKLKELEKKYGNDKERYSLEVQKLYKKEKVSMLGGCLPLLITFPIMIGLYSVVRQPLTHIFGLSAEQIAQIAEAMSAAGAKISDTAKSGYLLEINVASNLSQFRDAALTVVPNLPNINFSFLGLDLAAIPNFKYITTLWIIPALSAITSYGYSWISKKTNGTGGANSPAAGANGMMTIMMPLMSAWIAFCVPAGLGLYWIVSNVLSIAQEPILTRYYMKKQAAKALAGGNENGKKH